MKVLKPAIIYTGYNKELPIYSIASMERPVTLMRCSRDHDYEEGLKTLWYTKADLVVIEHDVRATPEHVEELLLCPYILCAFAYWLYPVTTGGNEAVIAHRLDGEFISEGAQFADTVGLGLTKFSKYARQEINTWDSKGSWHNLDQRISEAFSQEGFLFHVHWPTVEHEHKGMI